MDITKILNTNRVILDMKATNKTEAIEELTDLLQKDGAISCRETFIQDVWQRESEGSTGFENHIAIPHGKSSAVVNTTLAIDAHARIFPGKPWMAVMCVALFYLLYGLKIKIRRIFACFLRWRVHWRMKRSSSNYWSNVVHKRLLTCLVNMPNPMFAK
jgi:hypothetical protein